MIFSTTRNEVNSSADSYPVGYNSTILKEFVDTLERLKDPQTLDVGPVCQENITFFALRMGRHYVCDMFLRLKGQKRKDLLSAKGWNHLDFPARTFDGIQLWDLCDHLEDEEVSRLVTLCHTMLRDKGLLMMIALEKKPLAPLANTFVIGHDCRLDIRPQPHLELPWNFRHNRALTSLLSDFTIVRSFRYHSGVREFLFKKTGGMRS